MINIMADLETMGNGNNAAIAAIGAVAFDPLADVINTPAFYVKVNLESCVKSGLKLDASTILWWLRQSTEARSSTFEGETTPLGDALWQFSKWIAEVADNPLADVIVWGNGATFDNVILRSAFAAVDLPVPWKYYHDRCYRTMKSLVDVPYEKFGTAHNALDDAIGQAKHLQKIYKALALKC